MSTLMYLLHTLFAVVGRLFGQAVSGRRDVDNKRRDLRVQFLVDAWRSLARASQRAGRDEVSGVREALADIQLFGTPEQANRRRASPGP